MCRCVFRTDRHRTACQVLAGSSRPANHCGTCSAEPYAWPNTAQSTSDIPSSRSCTAASCHGPHTYLEDIAAKVGEPGPAHDMIVALPQGYDTLLDRTFKDGQDLSGGQWQRITAARGFLRDAELLIMDEPSSALDPKAERALFQAIRDRQGHTTTILITHRLANVRHADVIYVLDHGRLIESGSHDELMAHGGAYASLFTLQAKGYAH